MYLPMYVINERIMEKWIGKYTCLEVLGAINEKSSRSEKPKKSSVLIVKTTTTNQVTFEDWKWEKKIE